MRYEGRRRGSVYGAKLATARLRVKEAKPNGRTRRRLEQITKVSGIRKVLPPLGGTAYVKDHKGWR